MDLSDVVIYTPKLLWAGTFGNFLRVGLQESGVKVEERSDLSADLGGHWGFNVTHFVFKVGNKQSNVYWDWSTFDKFHPEVMKKDSDFYFKNQCKKHFLQDKRVYPINNVVWSCHHFLPLVKKLRDVRAECWKNNKWKYDVVALLKATDTATRYPAIESLRKSGLNCLLGISFHRRRKLPPGGYIKKIDPEEHWMAQAQSKLCVCIRGSGGFWTWRFSEVLAMGAAALQPDNGGFVYPRGYEGTWLKFGNPESIGEVAKQYCQNDELRKSVEDAGLRYYESQVKPVSMVKYMIDVVKGERNA